ncbi:cellobiose phosphorylase, partial [bacterium]|nr:cellobiose phosphorylase [bacterium]
MGEETQSDVMESPPDAQESQAHRNPLTRRARDLARVHVVRRDLTTPLSLLQRLEDLQDSLKRVHRAFLSLTERQPVPSSAAEWLLDNYYVVQQAVRRIEEDMPGEFYRELPILETTDLAGFPRIYALALELVGRGEFQVDLANVREFLEAYQALTPLNIGELWALPVMLRFRVIENLSAALDEVLREKIPEQEKRDAASDIVVANSILDLRRLGVQDWKTFFEEISLVDRILAEDPAGVYSTMEFETRDAYRKAIEDLASRSPQEETEAARESVWLAQRARARARHVSRECHVGFYLLDAGRRQLENHLGYRPSFRRRVGRWFFSHAVFTYLGSTALLTIAFSAVFVWYALAAGGGPLWAMVAAFLLLVPGLTVATTLVNMVVTHILPPRILPKMDYSEGIPADCQTMLVMPTLLTSEAEVDSLLKQIELHYLRNSDPNLTFALLTDFADATHQYLSADEVLLSRAEAGIRRLNRRHGAEGEGPFYLFHRQRKWNPQENVWMGWERKRGKLEEFNHLLLGKGKTSFTVQIGRLNALSDVRYVITLDADTILPRQGAARLVGTLSHPLNRPFFDQATGRVSAGYTVLQPRTEVQAVSANQTHFSRIYAGDSGLDLYTLAVSDVYQDLFGEGIYVGKGIYDVSGFERSLEERVPENTLLSHDLFEGIQGRAGLVSDIVLYEDYPSEYVPFVKRMSRWIRGDWQLLPWLLPKVPNRDTFLPNGLGLLERWKILDNLRRSLLSPGLLVLLLMGWLVLPGSGVVWTLTAVLTPAAPLLASVGRQAYRSLRGAPLAGFGRSVRAQLTHWLLGLVFLAYEAYVCLNAVVSTLFRLMISRRGLLQWTTAAQVDQAFREKRKRVMAWGQMFVSPLITVVSGGALVWLDCPAMYYAAPLLVGWLVAPEVALWISRPVITQPPPLDEKSRMKLRRLARRTWLYFELYVTPEDHWLAPDHFQESPRGMVAHRTSPTNIGLGLLATVAAYEMGYTGLLSMLVRTRDTFENMSRLEKHRGHYLNWYDTRTLDSLPPRYISTVDSGNLAGCLVALRQFCLSRVHAPVLRSARWDGFLDILSLLEEVIGRLEHVQPSTQSHLQSHLKRVEKRVMDAREHMLKWPPLLNDLREKEWPKLAKHLVALMEAGMHGADPRILHSLHVWSERSRHHLDGMKREMEALVPWAFPLSRTPRIFSEMDPDTPVGQAWRELRDSFPEEPILDEIGGVIHTSRSKLAFFLEELSRPDLGESQTAEARRWCSDLGVALDQAGVIVGETDAVTLCRDLSDRAEADIQAMDFRFLYDRRRHVFHIGYNADTERPDANFYDLLASEARIASLVAIAKGDVSQTHWLHLGRPVAQVDSTRVLLSWNGTMFEYLMPRLLIHNYPNTLLAQSLEGAVRRQIEYGLEKRTPWGISESGYYAFDSGMSYQYRGFGIPDLAFKRGLGKDHVVAPYASMLALAIRPREVVSNLDRFDEMKMIGDCGLYEAIDYTGSRMPLGQEYAVIRSYMVHHQGMVQLALANYLHDDVFVEHFHADPRIQSVDLLLQEMVPTDAPVEEKRIDEALTPTVKAETAERLALPWAVSAQSDWPSVHYLSNGRYGLLYTSAGGGVSRWRNIDLTRWRADSTLDDWGTWIYLKDLATEDVWSAGLQPTGAGAAHKQVVFHPHMIEVQCTHDDIVMGLEIAVSPIDDVEIRWMRLTNRSSTPKRLLVSSYAEVCLNQADGDRRHPVYSKMFIESEYISDVNGLLFNRRPREAAADNPYMVHCLLTDRKMAPSRFREGSRGNFLGRGGSTHLPAALGPDGSGFTGVVGCTLDPIMALGQEIEMEAHSNCSIAFLTLAAESRDEALELARRYYDWGRLRHAFDQARTSAETELQRLEFGVSDLEKVQQVLSALLYPNARLRAGPEILGANRAGQQRLWPYAISGDYPILLVSLSSDEDLRLVNDLVRAHRYWRGRGLMIDLVILNEKETGYAQELHGQLHRLLSNLHSDAWLNKRGGIFLLRADTISSEDLVLLQSAARVILDAEKGGLAEQLRLRDSRPASLPALDPTRVVTREEVETTPRLTWPNDLRYDNDLGGFTPDGREYVIYLKPGEWTPQPWVNVIANPEFGFLVSDCGSGYTWAVNSGENRLTSWGNDPVEDSSGEALYLRDEETVEVWSPTRLPAEENAPYLIRHGAGYSVFEHHSHGLKQKVCHYAAERDPVKIIELRLENVWDRPRRITATYYAEWVLGVHRDNMQQYMIPESDEEGNALLVRNPYNTEFGKRVAFLSSSERPHGITADRTEFLGRLGSAQYPRALS